MFTMSFPTKPNVLSGGAWGNMRSTDDDIISYGNGDIQQAYQQSLYRHEHDRNDPPQQSHQRSTYMHDRNDSPPQSHQRSTHPHGRNDSTCEGNARAAVSRADGGASKDRTMIILRGLPGSGKSTLADTLGGVKVSADDYFTDRVTGVYNFDPKKLKKAHARTVDCARRAIRNGQSPVCVDNTNTQLWQMQPYVRLAVDNGYTVLFREPDTPWRYDVQELARRTCHGVPPASIQRMLTDFYRGPLTVETVLNAPSVGDRPPERGRGGAANGSYQAAPDRATRRGRSPPPHRERRRAESPPCGRGRDDERAWHHPWRDPRGHEWSDRGGYHNAVQCAFPHAPSYTAVGAPGVAYPLCADGVDWNPHAYDACRAPPPGAWGGGDGGVGGVVVPRVRRRSGRLLLVIDVNGLLVDRVKKQHVQDHSLRPDLAYGKFVAFERPHARRFVRWLLDCFDVAVWSSAKRQNILPVVKHITGDKFHRVLHVFDQDSCVVRGTVPTNHGTCKPRFVKPLTAVWERVGEGPHIDPLTTLLIDDDAFKAELNPPHTAIHPPVFSHAANQTYGDGTDRPLAIPHGHDSRVNCHSDPRGQDELLDTRNGPLYQYLSRLAAEAVDVPSFVRQNPFDVSTSPRHHESNYEHRSFRR
eukprot:m.11672 g.11672  ORF g.11672 m.11672 type:complete len:641 (+) comp8872_c0_seq1:347-2269(+)